MRKYFYNYFFVSCLTLLLLGRFSHGADKKGKGIEDIRSPVVAGSWYSAKPDELRETLQSYLAEDCPELPNVEVKGIIAPHAGYRYSGAVAACAYRILKGKTFTRVVLVGPSHHLSFRGISINLQSGYESPLGTVPVDAETAKKLVDAGPEFKWLREAHALEHSLEIQLPFLQEVLGTFRIVPVIMGRQDFATCKVLAKALVELLGHEEDTLFVASTDLSHYHSYIEAGKLDGEFINYVAALDPEGLAGSLMSGKCEACGGGPAISVMLTAAAIGADEARILRYANSGDVTGDRHRVVGYLAAAFVRSSDKGPHPR